MNSPELNDRYRSIKKIFQHGEFFRSYDLADTARKEVPGDTRFAHLAVISLANAGAIELALVKYNEFELGKSDKMDDRTLLARLKKDLGFATSGAKRHTLHEEARTLYEAVYKAELAQSNPEAYYPAINAAALALWTDDRAAAVRLAKEVLELLAVRLTGAKQDDWYWVQASALEATFILGEIDDAKRMAQALLKDGGGELTEIASTGRQLRRIADAVGFVPAFVNTFTPPGVIHYTGHIISGPNQPKRLQASEEAEIRRKIDFMLEEEKIGSGYGSLAAGADILFAEALLARNAKLNLILPFNQTEFLEHSVCGSGARWVARFDACLKAASTVRYAVEGDYLGDDALFHYCSRLGMGLAALAARHLQAPVMQMAVWDGEATGGACGTVVDMKVWKSAGLPQTIIRCGSRIQSEDLSRFTPPAMPHGSGREVVAMFFGDVHGFSKLSDSELPSFVTNLMGAVGARTQPYHPKASLVNTWGDGVFTVFKDAVTAATWALEVQDAMRKLNLPSFGLREDLQFRFGGHLGPAYEMTDPVTGRHNFYGAHVSRAARIEPITPEGCIYVTETFAAILALEAPLQFESDYVGITQMAKQYGEFRMFLLRPKGSGVGPVVLRDIEKV